MKRHLFLVLIVAFVVLAAAQSATVPKPTKVVQPLPDVKDWAAYAASDVSFELDKASPDNPLVPSSRWRCCTGRCSSLWKKMTGGHTDRKSLRSRAFASWDILL